MPFIFVVGNSRSGTTMMGRVLNNHPVIHTFPELHFFEQLWSSADRDKILSEDKAIQLASLLLNISREGYFSKRHVEDFRGEAIGILATVQNKKGTEVLKAVCYGEAKRNGKQNPCEQTPQNVFYIREILDEIPDSYFINMVRDPRDVLLSQKRKWKRRFLGGTHATWFETVRAWINYHPIIISKLWNAAIQARNNAVDRRVMTVQFESLLQQPDKIIESICFFLQIPFSPDLKKVPQVGSSSGMDQKEVREINSDRAQSWRNGGLNSAEIWLCQKICDENMKQLGYQPVQASANILLVIFYYLLFPFKLIFAILLNLNRMKNIFETIKKRLKQP